MATYFVASSGSNTAPYDTWAKAATSIATALTAATASGDIIAIDAAGVPSGDAESAADTTYTAAGNVLVLASTNSGTSTVTPTTMGTSAWIGNSTTNRSVIWAGAFRVKLYGLTFRVSGASADSIHFSNVDGGHFEAHACYLWDGNTANDATAGIKVGSSAGSPNTYVRLVGCTLRFGHASHRVTLLSGVLDIDDCTISSAGTAPTGSLFNGAGAGGTVHVSGGDWSFGGTCPIVGTTTSGNLTVTMDRVKLGAAITTAGFLIASPSITNKGGAVCEIRDCSNGDTHGLFGYADSLGTLVSDTGIYFTSGAATQSWKITTTANASRHTPFVAPMLRYHNTTLSAVAPYVEILRDTASAAAYTDAEVWLEVLAKVTASSPAATLSSDASGAADTTGSAQSAGAGLGSWTGEANGTAWSGKIGETSVTPAENGHISARVCVGLASTTVYVDPQIRT